MNLDQITVQIRPRNQWEAIDIGFVVARNWFARLWLLYIATSLPFVIGIVLVCLVLPGSEQKWSLILFWLCKPLYEPAMLLWTSRAVFGEELTTKKTIFESRKIISFKQMWSVWVYRLSPSRSFTFPILLLERLKGKKRRERSELLSNGYETSIYLTAASFCVELVMTLSLLTVLFWFIPAELRWLDFGDFVFRADSWITLAAYFFTCSVVAPFYTCGGFMLYISRRVELEAWDIEIGFKRIEQRFQERKNNIGKGLACFLLLCLPIVAVLIAGTASTASAVEPDPESAKAAITQVLQQKDFGVKKTVYRWVAKQEEEPEKDSNFLRMLEYLFKWLGGIGDMLTKHIGAVVRFAAWIFAGCVLSFVLLRYSQISQWLSWRMCSDPKAFSPPSVMFGMDIRPESLPENIEATCKELLAKGEKRKVLSLLYRSSLSCLVNDLQLPIRLSYTEQECRNEVIKYRPEKESSYFSELTTIWLTTAYGHREPDTRLCKELVGQWQHHFGM